MGTGWGGVGGWRWEARRHPLACDTRESGGGAQEVLVERRAVGAIPASAPGPKSEATC